MKSTAKISLSLLFAAIILLVACGGPHRHKSKKFSFCFTGDTKVKMANGKEMEIKDLKKGDIVVSAGLAWAGTQTSEVLQTEKMVHDNLVTLKFEKTSLKVTNDHPIWVKGKGWASIDVEKTKASLSFDKVSVLAAGDICFFLNEKGEMEETRLQSIEKLKGSFVTYTITKLNRNNKFFANGIAVAVEEVRGMP